MVSKLLNLLVISLVSLLYIATLEIFAAWPLAIIVLILFVLISLISLPRNKLNLVLILMISFFILALITSIFSIYSFDALKLSLIIGISSICVLWITSSDIFEKKTFINVLYSIVCLQTFNAIYGIIVRLLGTLTTSNGDSVYQLKLLFFEFNSSVSGSLTAIRIGSLFENPNTFALYSLLAVIFGYYLLRENKFSKKVYAFIFIVNILAIFFAFSRAVILLLLVILIIFLIEQSLKLTYMKIAFSILVILVTIVFIMLNLDEIVSSISNTRFSQDINGRDLAWAILLEYIKENIFLGAGFGQGYSVVLSDQLDYGAHNVYILILAEMGILGFLMFFSIIISTLILSFRKVFIYYKEGKNSSMYASYALVGTVLLIITLHQIFEAQLMRISLLQYIWVIFLGFLMKLERR